MKPHAGCAGKILPGVCRVIQEAELKSIFEFLAGNVGSDQGVPAVVSAMPSASGATANTSYTVCTPDFPRVKGERIIPLAVNPMSAFVAFRKASVTRLARMVPAALMPNEGNVGNPKIGNPSYSQIGNLISDRSYSANIRFNRGSHRHSMRWAP